MIKKTVRWAIRERDYAIHNVPFEKVENEEIIDLDASIKVGALRDLMVSEELPEELDFEQFDDISF